MLTPCTRSTVGSAFTSVRRYSSAAITAADEVMKTPCGLRRSTLMLISSHSGDIPDKAATCVRGTNPVPDAGSSDAATCGARPAGTWPAMMPGHVGAMPVRVGERRGRIRRRVTGQPDQRGEVTVQPGGGRRRRAGHGARLDRQLQGAEMRVAGVHAGVDDGPHDALAAGVVGAPARVRLDGGRRPVDLRIKHVVRPRLEDGQRRVRAPGGRPVPPDQPQQLAPGQQALVKPGRHPLQARGNSGDGRRNGDRRPGGAGPAGAGRAAGAGSPAHCT